jgi:NADPH2:quinone reductase
MRAVMFVPGPNGAVPEVRDIPMPVPGPGEVLVKVRAAGLNRGEIAVRAGLKSGAPQQSGIEFAGEVVGVGEGASMRRSGERVMGHWRAGQAEYVAVDERLLVPVPERLSWIEAGAWLNVFCTAHDAIVTNGRLQKGESILVNAASSGIGVATLQIAKLLGASPILGSSRSSAKLEKLKPWGLQVGIDALASPEHIRKATGGKGVDLLIDNIGGPALQRNLESMAILGRMVSVGRLAAHAGSIDLDLLAFKRVQLIGVTFRTRSKEERIACVQRCAADLLGPLAEGRLQPVVQRSFPMAEIRAAHDAMERDEHIGKLVLEIS